MAVSLDVPDLVRQRALSAGVEGQRWLRDLPDVVASCSERWGLELERSLPGGTASFVAAAIDNTGRTCVLKVAMPLDEAERQAFARSALTHRLADGRGCARLLHHDESTPAMLLERLGPNLDKLRMPLPEMLLTIAMTLRSFWQPVAAGCGLPSGADKAAWQADDIATMWDHLGQPCQRAVIDRAVAYCEDRAAAFDPAQAVLVHGDAHGLEHVRGRRRHVQVRRSRRPAIRTGPRSRCADAGVQPTAPRWRHLPPCAGAGRAARIVVRRRSRSRLAVGLHRASLDGPREHARLRRRRRHHLPRGCDAQPLITRHARNAAGPCADSVAGTTRPTHDESVPNRPPWVILPSTRACALGSSHLVTADVAEFLG